MSVRKEKDGTWTVDVSSGKNPVTQKRVRIVRKKFKSKKEAIEQEQYIRIVELKEKNSNYSITVDMLYGLLQEEDKQNQRKMSYRATQKNNYNKHIYPYFKDTDMSLLSYEHIYQFRETLKEKNTQQDKTKKLSNNTINKIIILLRKLYEVGIRKQLLKDNPVKGLRKLPIKKPTLNFWTPDEFKHFTTLFNDEDEYQYKLFFTLAYFTGMRQGEILALTWEYVDLHHMKIRTQDSMYTVDGKNIISPAKTEKSIRDIHLNNKLNSMLSEWNTKQLELLGKFTNSPEKLQVIQSTPIVVNKNMVEKKFKKILARDKSLKPIRIHDLRHSHASLLIHQGEDYLVVKERLGHASITTTIDTYSHLFPSKQRTLADKLDDLF